MSLFSNTLHRSLTVIVLVTFVLVGATWAIQAHATSNGTVPVNGYAWSSNIGWIQFSGKTTANASFGVREVLATGVLSGYAWSSNIGWINFSGTQISLTTGVLSGYAQACAAYANKNLCSGALDPNSGGWDGRIHLSGTALNGSTYKITQNANCTWSGYAWGSDGIGAIHMKGTTYGVKVGGRSNNCSLSPIATLSVNPTTIDSGQSVKVTWSSTNATSCTAVQGNFSTGGKTNGTVSTGPLSTNTLYQISCTGPRGTTKSNIQRVTVRVPTVSISASPSRVAKGGLVTLKWNAANINSCTITKNGNVWKKLTANASRTVSGTATDTIIAQTIYRITCTNNASASAVSSTQIVNLAQTFSEF